MLDREMVHQDFGLVEDTFAPPVGDGWELSLLLATQEASAALARAQEQAVIEAEDVCRKPTRLSSWGRKIVPFSP